MPARPLDYSRASVYLDTSALVYAFESAQIGAPPQLASGHGLLAMVEDIAHRQNLIFSLFHLLELANYGDHQRARAILAWLDGLPLVWIRDVKRIFSDEDEFWLKKVAGHQSPTPVAPFAPSMLSTFEGLSVDDSARLLGSYTLPQIFDSIKMPPR